MWLPSNREQAICNCLKQSYLPRHWLPQSLTLPTQQIQYMSMVLAAELQPLNKLDNEKCILAKYTFSRILCSHAKARRSYCVWCFWHAVVTIVGDLCYAWHAIITIVCDLLPRWNTAGSIALGKWPKRCHMTVGELSGAALFVAWAICRYRIRQTECRHLLLRHRLSCQDEAVAVVHGHSPLETCSVDTARTVIVCPRVARIAVAPMQAFATPAAAPGSCSTTRKLVRIPASPPRIRFSQMDRERLFLSLAVQEEWQPL